MLNICDEALGLIYILLSLDLLLHLDNLETPNEALEKFKNIFGKTYSIQGHNFFMFELGS